LARKSSGRPGAAIAPHGHFAFPALIGYSRPIMVERIGEALVRIGAMKSFQVEDVLRLQRNGDTRMFGEIAIELGYIDDAAIKRYLEAKQSAQA